MQNKRKYSYKQNQNIHFHVLFLQLLQAMQNIRQMCHKSIHSIEASLLLLSHYICVNKNTLTVTRTKHQKKNEL